MSKTNFSVDQQNALDVALDLVRCNYDTMNGIVSKAALENKLREIINKDIFEGRNFRQAMRRHSADVYEIIEEIVSTSLGEGVMDSPFVQSFVEVKNRALGDKSAFYAEGNLLTATELAGNHWDINRQRIDLGEEFMLPTKWIGIRVYEDLERFLLGITSLDALVDKVYAALNRYIQEALYVQFQKVADSVPSEFTATGNDENALAKHCDLIQAAGRYDSLVIAGTKGALRKIANIVPQHMFANSQKEAKASTGAIAEWEGNKLMPIPQVLKTGTYELALSDSDLFIMGGGSDVRPIKLEIIGDTRAIPFDETGHRNNDMSLDMQVQTNIGIGMILPDAFGVFHFA